MGVSPCRDRGRIGHCDMDRVVEAYVLTGGSFNCLFCSAYKYTYLTDIPEDAFLIQHVVSGFPSPQTTK